MLVVDDDVAVRDAMRLMLETWGCEVETAAFSESVHRAFKRMQPELLLFDYHLDDGVTGLQLHEELGLEAGFRPCIIITADHDPAIRATVEAAGCFLLYKPLKPLALKAMMARLLTHADQGQR